MLTAILIFIFTLTLVIWQPRGMALAGAPRLGQVSRCCWESCT